MNRSRTVPGLIACLALLIGMTVFAAPAPPVTIEAVVGTTWLVRALLAVLASLACFAGGLLFLLYKHHLRAIEKVAASVEKLWVERDDLVERVATVETRCEERSGFHVRSTDRPDLDPRSLRCRGGRRAGE